MKTCPNCGMHIRDDLTVCGYCGEDVPDKPGRMAAVPAWQQPEAGVPEGEGDEAEEGGLSAILQPGENVRIGSLNISVKKFFFHGYLTNQRIFLIDTQEKKLKVTAKDIPLDTIAGSIVEYSENSDPVLVLSVKGIEDEIKTMKLVFVQDGMDRAGEVNEWITLLSGKKAGKAKKRPAEKPRAGPEEIPEEEEEEVPLPAQKVPVKKEPVRMEKPVVRQELHPVKKPAKNHEKQPPVKRIVPMYRTPEPAPVSEEVKEEPQPPQKPAPAHAPPRKPVVIKTHDRPAPPAQEEPAEQPRKPEVKSAMKVAMKSAMQPLRQQPAQTLKRPAAEPGAHPGPVQPRDERAEAPRRPTIEEKAPDRTTGEEGTAVPQFCHNCGKKLPDSANFCPGCGTRLSPHRTLPRLSPRALPVSREKKAVPEERRPAKVTLSEEEEELEDEKPQPVKPPEKKKAPKGSEMTILHKFLRR